MASQLFCYGLGDNLGFEAYIFLRRRFSSSSSLGRAMRDIHATEFCAPLVKGRGADAMLAVEFRDGRARLGLLEDGDDLSTLKRDVFI